MSGAMFVSRNSEVEDTTTRDIVGSRAFSKGYQDYKQGRPFNVDAYDEDTEHWEYERGRLFAASLKARGYTLPPIRLRGRINIDVEILLD